MPIVAEVRNLFPRQPCRRQKTIVTGLGIFQTRSIDTAQQNNIARVLADNPIAFSSKPRDV